MNDQPQPSLNQQLYNAVAALAVAEDRYRVTAERAAQAQQAADEALAAVNEEQKKFDALTALVKKTAPGASRWAQP